MENIGKEKTMYKLTRPDGFDFYSKTINYRDNIGKIIRVTDFDPPKKGSCGKGLHASRNPNDCFIGARIPCAAFRVKGVQKIAGDKVKSRYQGLKVIEEITDLDVLFGWNYSEAINPINPFKIEPPEIQDIHIELLKKWASVRASVWDSMWDSVGAYMGSLFPGIKKWKHIEHKPGEYPFQPCVDLWKMGLVPSFDGKIWQIRGGEKGEVLYTASNQRRGNYKEERCHST